MSRVSRAPTHQRGTLRLLWCAVFVFLCSSVAMAALFSMRYERNLFAEGWARLQRVSGLNPDLPRQAAVLPAAGVRKCMVAGRVTYSNVDCNTKNPTAVTLNDSRGFEPAPSVPAAMPGVSDKMIEQMTQH